jgi:hypothetical protein
MRDQKNIDRLFQDKLEGFEQRPKPEVWSKIQDRMQQKKKRSIPFWWWYAGAAAVFILSLFVLLPEDHNKKNIITDPIITVSPNTEDKLNSPLKKEPQKPSTKPEVVKENNILITEKTKTNSDKTIASDKKNTLQKSAVSKTQIAENTEVNKLSTELKDKNIKQNESSKDSHQKEHLDKENTSLTNDVLKKEIDQQKTHQNKNSKSTFDITKPKDSLKRTLTNPKKKAFYTQLDEDLLDEKTDRKKWAVRPLIAMSTVTNSSNSPTDQIFSNNPTSGNAAFNYGVSVSYQVNKKITLQTGILTQNINFDTESVSLVQTPNAPRNQLSNIDLNGSLPFALSGAADAAALSDSFVASLNVPDSDARLNQTINYIEIPIEVKYQVTRSKRLHTSVIGGFSSLFLNENDIVLDSKIVGRRSIGTANNLNSVNFSGNIGVELDYKIYKQLFFNVNPMMKVHLNTFSRNNNGYLPVFVGVYSGIKYQF